MIRFLLLGSFFLGQATVAAADTKCVTTPEDAWVDVQCATLTASGVELDAQFLQLGTELTTSNTSNVILSTANQAGVTKVTLWLPATGLSGGDALLSTGGRPGGGTIASHLDFTVAGQWQLLITLANGDAATLDLDIH